MSSAGNQFGTLTTQLGASLNQRLAGSVLKGFSEADSGYCPSVASTLGEFGVLISG
jgi:hypothetical protein